MNILLIIKRSHVDVMSLSLRAWWPGGKKLLLILSVFAIMLRKRLPDGSKMKRRLHDDFSSSAFAAFEVDVLQRGESRPWDALS